MIYTGGESNNAINYSRDPDPQDTCRVYTRPTRHTRHQPFLEIDSATISVPPVLGCTKQPSTDLRLSELS